MSSGAAPSASSPPPSISSPSATSVSANFATAWSTFVRSWQGWAIMAGGIAAGALLCWCLFIWLVVARRGRANAVSRPPSEPPAWGDCAPHLDSPTSPLPGAVQPKLSEQNSERRDARDSAARDSTRELAHPRSMQTDVAGSCLTSLVQRPSRSASIDGAGDDDSLPETEAIATPTAARMPHSPTRSPSRLQDDLTLLRRARAQSKVHDRPASATSVEERGSNTLKIGEAAKPRVRSPRLSTDSLEDVLNEVDAAALDAMETAKILAPSPVRLAAIALLSNDPPAGALPSVVESSAPIEGGNAASKDDSSGSSSGDEPAVPSEPPSAPSVPKLQLGGGALRLAQTHLAVDGLEGVQPEKREMQHNPFLEKQYDRQKQHPIFGGSSLEAALEAAMDRRLERSDSSSATADQTQSVGYIEHGSSPSVLTEACSLSSIESIHESQPGHESTLNSSGSFTSSCPQPVVGLSDRLCEPELASFPGAACGIAAFAALERTPSAPAPEAHYVSSTCTGPSDVMFGWGSARRTVSVCRPQASAGDSPRSPQKPRSTHRPECISMLTGSTLPIQRPSSPSPNELPAPFFRTSSSKGMSKQGTGGRGWLPSHDSPRQAPQLLPTDEQSERSKPAAQELLSAEKLHSPAQQPKMRSVQSRDTRQAKVSSAAAQVGPAASSKGPPPRAKPKSSDQTCFRPPSPLSTSPHQPSVHASACAATPHHNSTHGTSLTPLRSAMCRSQLAGNRAQQLVMSRPAPPRMAYHQKVSPGEDNSDEPSVDHPPALPSLAPRPGFRRGDESGPSSSVPTWSI